MESAAPPEPSGKPWASEHEEIAVRLMAAGPGGVDQALLAAAAKALRDVSVLDKQLLRAREVSASLCKPLGCVCIVSRYYKPLWVWHCVLPFFLFCPPWHLHLAAHNKTGPILATDCTLSASQRPHCSSSIARLSSGGFCTLPTPNA